MLIFDEKLGIGYYPVSTNPDDSPYDMGYINNYFQYNKDNPAINDFRMNWVEEICPNKQYSITDVGIGCGTFMFGMFSRGYEMVYGNDINPVAVQALEMLNRFDDMKAPSGITTFWDSFEHLPRPQDYLGSTHVFMTLPIFTDREHILRSKHFKTDEHFWYFTKDGLLHFMENRGYKCWDINYKEVVLGREDVASFYFQRDWNVVL